MICNIARLDQILQKLLERIHVYMSKNRRLLMSITNSITAFKILRHSPLHIMLHSAMLDAKV